MRFKLGLLVGGAIGYYYGAKAGRQRYEEIERVLDRVRAHPAYQSAAAELLGRAEDAKRTAKRQASGLADSALSSVLGGPEPTFEPGLEFNPDFSPTEEEILADFRGQAPSA